MKTVYRLVIAISVVLAFSLSGAAQEPGEQDELEALRREVSELRQLVEELTRRLEGVEYQRLPRLAQPRDAEKVVFDDPANAPGPDWLPGENRSKLRFPYDIERGSSAPVHRLAPGSRKR